MNRVYNTAGVYGAVLTVTTLAGATDTFEMNVIVDEDIAPTPGGGSGRIVRITKSGPGAVATSTSFIYTITVTNTGSTVATDITMTDALPGGMLATDIFFTTPGADSCGGLTTVTCTSADLDPGEGYTVLITATSPSSPTSLSNVASLTVASPSESSNARARTAVSLMAPAGSPGRVATRLTSHLDLPPADGSTQAQVTFNEFSSAVTDNSGPSTHDVPGRSGENIVEGFVTKNPRGEGVWRFDFRGAPGFLAGSFLVDTGQVVSRLTHEIVFRVAPGVRRVRFRYRLE